MDDDGVSPYKVAYQQCKRHCIEFIVSLTKRQTDDEDVKREERNNVIKSANKNVQCVCERLE